MEILSVLLAYMNPQATLPLVSAVAAIAGFILLVGLAPLRFIVRGFRSTARSCRRVVLAFRRVTRRVQSILAKLDC
jgi:hypothetical protein